MAGYVAKWNLKAVVDQTEAQAARGLGRAAQYLVKRIKENVSRPGVKATTPFGSTTVMGKRVMRGATGGDIVRISRPGESPRLRTGIFRASSRAEIVEGSRGLAYKVGSDLPQAASLELGSRNMKPRPYLRSTLAQERSEMRAVFMGAATQTHAAPMSSELTSEDIERGTKNVFFQEAPAVGEL